ncbi:MAG: hypothetical protein J0M00_17605 [Burkholderiales bacterium]|nr:hypothetical protein [Burkholderiales bacterium]
MDVVIYALALVVGVVLYVRSKLRENPPPNHARSFPVDEPEASPPDRPPRLVPEHTETTSIDQTDRDAWEGGFWEVDYPRGVTTTLRFDYVDGQGVASQRTVDVRQFGAYFGNILIIGRCHMRNATRTFRSDRMANCVDVTTGEHVFDVADYLLKQYEASPQHSADRLLADEFDALCILLYVGKADGQLRAPERAVILEAAQTIAGDARLSPADIDPLLSTMNVPTEHAFKLAVGRLNKRPRAICMTVLNAAERIVGTQKTVHFNEQQALEYMRKRFG